MTNSKKLPVALTVPARSGCYVLPVPPDGHVYGYPPCTLPAPGVPSYPPAPTLGPTPTLLQARPYPANDIAAQTGVVTGN